MCKQVKLLLEYLEMCKRVKLLLEYLELSSLKLIFKLNLNGF